MKRHRDINRRKLRKEKELEHLEEKQMLNKKGTFSDCIYSNNLTGKIISTSYSSKKHGRDWFSRRDILEIKFDYLNYTVYMGPNYPFLMLLSFTGFSRGFCLQLFAGSSLKMIILILHFTRVFVLLVCLFRIKESSLRLPRFIYSQFMAAVPENWEKKLIYSHKLMSKVIARILCITQITHCFYNLILNS